jgi:hypothetical protein
MPDITVYMNCDTRLAINIGLFDLGEQDEFIFVIKNYNYVDSPYAFIYRARKSDMDKNGEVIFNIDPDASKNIKPGAFYNFAVLVNAFNLKVPSEYKKLTDNGRVAVEYGAHDLALPDPVEPVIPYKEIIAARIEETTDDNCGDAKGAILSVSVEKETD